MIRTDADSRSILPANLQKLRSERGYTTPISADIHFVAEAASVAARYVEKVRINPGNFADKRATFKKLTYTDEEYAAELEILRQTFPPGAVILPSRPPASIIRIACSTQASTSQLTYTDEEYAAELEILRQKFTEFLEVCRQYGTAVCISPSISASFTPGAVILTSRPPASIIRIACSTQASTSRVYVFSHRLNQHRFFR